MTDFIREVDEEVRQDKVRVALQRYWYVIAIAVVLILGGVGGWKAYDSVTTRKAEAVGGRYLEALDLAHDGKSDQAVAALKGVEADGTPGYRLLARLRLAGETGVKDPAAGAAMFDAVAADPAADPALQAAAKLRAALLRVDLLPYPALKEKLGPMADANNPLRNAAREMLGLAALKAGQTDDAGHYFDAIENDGTTTGNMRQRIAALQQLVRGAGRAPVAAVPPEAAAPASIPQPAPAPAAVAPAPAPVSVAPAPEPAPVSAAPAPAPAPVSVAPAPAPAPAPVPVAPAPAPASGSPAP